MAYNESFTRQCSTQGPSYSFTRNYCGQYYYNYANCEISYSNCTNRCYDYYYDYGDCEVSYYNYSDCEQSYSACYDVEATAYSNSYSCSNYRETSGYNNQHYDYCGDCYNYYYYERN